MRKIGNATLLLALSFVSSTAWAIQTAAPMRECVNCSASQMLAQAKNNPPGYVFIYDLSHNVIRKYEVYMDSTCGTQPVIQSGTSGGQQVQGGADGTDCGSFKAADEVTPVNPGVQAIFNSLRAAWLVNPTLVNTGKATVLTPPINPSRGRPFDIPKVGWDYDQGEYEDMREFLRDEVLLSRGAANNFAPGLGDYIFGVSLAVEGVDIGSPPDVVRVHIVLDHNTGTINIDICNSDLDCAKWTVTVTNGSITNVAFVGAFDKRNMMYPSQTGASPGGHNSWYWQYGSDADHFAQQIHTLSGVTLPSRPGCGSAFHYGLVVARVNGAVDSITWQCIPN